jgi:hypothetical protein
VARQTVALEDRLDLRPHKRAARAIDWHVIDDNYSCR